MIKASLYKDESRSGIGFFYFKEVRMMRRGLLNSAKAMILILLVMVFTVSLWGIGEDVFDESGQWKGRKVYSEEGGWTGLLNTNPDPNGEPWIVGSLPPLTPEEEAYFKSIPYFTVGDAPRADLPATVQHTTSPYFRPIFNQWGGSCGQASGIGYHYTFERNQTLNRPYNSNQDNVSAYIFTWNFVNDGINQGSWPVWGYDIARYMGVARESDFSWTGGTYYTNWMSGYSEYLNALECRVKANSIVQFDISDVESIKNWLYDKGTGTGTHGGIITMAAAWPWDTSATIASGPFAGQKVVTQCPEGSDHAVTIAGYSDEITVGTITGAFLVVNSHGTTWGNSGSVWVMYDAFDTTKSYYLYSMEVESHDPLLVIKAVVTSNTRNTIDIKTGYAAQTGASTPASTTAIPRAFNKTGGAYPMQGSGQSSTMEIAFDATSYIPYLSNGNGTIFLQIQGTGTVDSLSVYYYGENPPLEFTRSGLPVTISGTMNLGVNVTLSTPVVEKTGIVKNYPNPFNPSTLIDYELKESGVVDLRVYNAKGQTIRSLVQSTQAQGAYTVSWDGKDNQGADCPSGIYYIVMEINGEKHMHKAVLLK